MGYIGSDIILGKGIDKAVRFARLMTKARTAARAADQAGCLIAVWGVLDDMEDEISGIKACVFLSSHI